MEASGHHRQTAAAASSIEAAVGMQGSVLAPGEDSGGAVGSTCATESGPMD